MQNKLQELTDRLYNEGLSKGKKEGENILTQAKIQAEEIISEAKKEAGKIIENARKEAEDLKIKVEGDLKMAASQSVQSTKNDVENLIISEITDKQVSQLLSSTDFIKEIIVTVASKFKEGEPQELEFVLPESLKKDLEPFVKNELGKILNKGVTASFSKKLSGGFTIAPKDGRYFISFTDETFKELIGSYLRPTAKKLLFG